MRKHFTSILLILAFAGLTVLLSSCSKKSRLSVYPVNGQVFDKNNQPAIGALLIFHPVNASDPNTPKPLARVDDKGDFALTTYEKDDGGPEGEYVITIQWRKSSANPFAPNQDNKDLLRGAYSNPKTSQLKFTIVNQSNNAVPPIHLK